MRLTNNNGRLYVPMYEKKEAQISVNYHKYVNMYNKLADLEDIEDELRIDLITLFKAINEGAYFKRFVKGKVIAIEHHYIWFDLLRQIRYKDKDEGEVYISLNGAYCNDYEYKLKDYGKTWALTKEELEK